MLALHKPEIYSAVHHFQMDSAYALDLANFKWTKSMKKSSVNAFLSSCEIQEANPATPNGASTKWNVHKYENGCVRRHVDRQEDPNTIGVELLLPPKTVCSFEGGELVIGEDQKETIVPHETKWTYVFIPLGIVHEVKPVVGTRISLGRYVNQESSFHHEYPEGYVIESMSA